LTLLALAGLLSLTVALSETFQPSAHAATTFNVNTTGDGADSNLADNVCSDSGGNCSLRAAIQQANVTAGTDTINITVNGTINLTGALPELSTDMNINGPGSGLLTVRRDTGGDYRIFFINNRTVNLSGMTVTNGKTADGAPSSNTSGNGSQSGGGIQAFGVITLTDVVINDNRTGDGGDTNAGASSFGGTAGFGGGLSVSGTVTLTNCVVSNNRTGKGGTGGFAGLGGRGGGIYFSSGTLTMSNVSVTGNRGGDAGTGLNGGSSGNSGYGGGLYLGESVTANISNSNISSNATGDVPNGSVGDGGGIFIYSGTTTLTNTTVSLNSTGASLGPTGDGGHGGGIQNFGTLTLNNCTVSGNRTGTSNRGVGLGGGITNFFNLYLNNSTVSGNVTGNGSSNIGGHGGGIYSGTGNLTITNSTITGNTAANNIGNGIRATVGIVRNTLIAGNGGNGADASGTFTSQGHNLIGNGSDSTGFNAAGDQVGTTAAPIDPKLGPLANNGGPTFTHALLSGSPALDAGDNALAKDANNVALTTDQRGVGRFGGVGHVVDIGAYEFHPSLEDVSDKATNEDTTLSFSFAVGDGAANVTAITATSNNQALVPDAGLSVSGSGAVRTLQITPAANQTGTAQITISVTYSGGAVSNDTFQLTVNPVNDAPSFTKGADQTVAEDAGPQTVNNWATAISPGPNESSQTVSFLVTANSNASLFSTAPAVSSNGTLTYTPAANANGSATITLVAKDDGGTANGGQDTSAAQTFNITVTPVNDPPVAQDQSVTTSEDTSRFISFTANDVEGNSLTFTVLSNPSHGTLTGSGSSRTYTPALNYVGADSFTFKATDSLGADSQTATISINVTAVNDPPLNTVPASQATDQNTTLVFSSANANAISVADVDAGTDPLRVTLTATNGTLTLAGTNGLTFSNGDGTDDATMTFAGTITDLNAALNGLAFKPTTGFSGAASLQISTNDQGFNGSGGARTDTDFVNITVRPGAIEFKQSSYTASEGAGPLAVVVRRTGDTSQTASVAYATDDGSIPSVSVPCSSTTGAALDRCDFTKALGRLVFAPGETEKTINVLLGDDSYVEGTETALIRLSSVNGTGVVLGSRTVATLEIVDNAQESSANPIDETGRFVRQHYADFLGREPDAPGLAFWTGEIEQCGTDAQCREVKRINVSAAFFLSIEFQQTGYLVYRLDKVAFGNISTVKPVPVTLSEFLSDTQSIGQGVVVGADGWEQKLEANKQSFVNAFVQRSRFLSRYPTSTTPEQYVDSLNSNAGGALSQEERDGLVADLKSGAKTRAQVLRVVAEHQSVVRREFNQAFVLMQFFGYLRRDPDSAPDNDFAGYSFWLSKLNEFNGNYIQAEMVKAFIQSDEYRKRFGL
jgi:CSLREA domain-containing protein